tara:strand:+ start:1830 stop:2432 length:603 start_codon:yes stop_codon:yes gene_type:complete
MEEKEDFWGEVESSQNETIPSVMISGEPQTVPAAQQMYGAQQQMILLQQPSSAPKVIGIFVIIYGAINALLGLIGALGGALLAESEVFSASSDGSLQVILFALLSVGFGIGFIITGVQINNRKKIGVQLSWILIALSLVLGLLQTMLATPEEIATTGLNNEAFYGIQIGGTIVCNAICGLLVAIPLMVNNSMMDDSSLWG